MVYYFVADEFDRYDMSFGVLQAVSTEFESLRAAYPSYPIWKYEGETLFDLESLEDEDPRITPYDGNFEGYHCFETEEEFEKVTMDWDKMSNENLYIEIDWEETYVQGKLVSGLPSKHVDEYREKLRQCIQISVGQTYEMLKSLVEALKTGALSTDEFITKIQTLNLNPKW